MRPLFLRVFVLDSSSPVAAMPSVPTPPPIPVPRGSEARRPAADWARERDTNTEHPRGTMPTGAEEIRELIPDLGTPNDMEDTRDKERERIRPKANDINKQQYLLVLV